jgi:hypothetical protein
MSSPEVKFVKGGISIKFFDDLPSLHQNDETVTLVGGTSPRWTVFDWTIEGWGLSDRAKALIIASFSSAVFHNEAPVVVFSEHDEIMIRLMAT